MKKILFITFLALLTTTMFSQSLVRDSSFGNLGIVNTNYQYNSGDAVYRIISLADHKFIGIGQSKIIRFNENGTIDNSFGVNGEFQFPEQIQGLVHNVKLIDNFFYFLGYANYNTDNSDDGLILRVTYDGLLDTTFANNGILLYHINENEAFYNIEITPDNKIIAVGIKKTYPWQKLFIAKFNSNGTIDSSFQNNGYKEIYVFPVATEIIENLSVIDNNKFIIACTGRMNINNNYSQLALIKLDTDGNFDLSFNSSGTYILPPNRPFYFDVKFFGNFLYVRNVDNNIYDTNYDATLFKINLSDLTSHTTLIDRDAFDYFIHNDLSISTLSMNRDQINIYPNRNLFIKKYNTNGILDNSFCGSGIYEFNLSDINNYQTDDIPGSIIIYEDKILVLGQSQIPQSGINGFNCTLTRFNQTTLSTETFQNEKITLFPNPALDFIKVHSNDMSYPVNIKIFNLLGEVVYESSLFDKDSKINVSNLQNDMFILKITDAQNNMYFEKFLKK